MSGQTLLLAWSMFLFGLMFLLNAEAKLTFTCGAEADNLVSMQYTGDGDAVFAMSRNKRTGEKSQCKFLQDPLDPTVFTFQMKLYSSDPKECQFKKKRFGYKAIVVVRKGAEQLVMAHDNCFLVNCIYGKNFKPSQSGRPVISFAASKAKAAPVEIIPVAPKKPMAPKSTSTFVVNLVDREGLPLGTGILDGYMIVKLQAHMTPGGGSEKGFKAMNCWIYKASGSKVMILVNGCGTGLLFGEDEGFTSKSYVANSPFFKLSQLGSGASTFGCDFTASKTAYDGSSCMAKLKGD